MVFAIRCPSPTCRKYMLVEDDQRGKVIRCLICGIGIRTGAKSDADPVKDAPVGPRKNDSR